MKKKFQISALKKAAKRTGNISNKLAITETVTNKTNAVTLYPIKPERKKQTAETNRTIAVTTKYCLPLGVLLKINCFKD